MNTTVLQQFDFWFWYFSLCYEDQDLPPEFEHCDASAILRRMDELISNQTTTFSFHDNALLKITISAGRIELWLRFEDEDIQLGWVDGHFCPEALRLEELKVILADLPDSQFAPGLLLQFLSIGSEEELLIARELLSQMMIKNETLKEPEAEAFSRMVFPDDCVRSEWTFDDGFWIASEESYSVRSSDTFDHARFSRFMNSRGTEARLSRKQP